MCSSALPCVLQNSTQWFRINLGSDNDVVSTSATFVKANATVGDSSDYYLKVTSLISGEHLASQRAAVCMY